MAKRLFQQSLSDHCVGRSLSFGKVVAYSPRGLLPHKRICLLYSIFKEPWRKLIKALIFKIVAEQERGVSNQTPLKTAYSSISKGISKSNIIFINASLIRPFNSISTAI